MFSSRSRYYSTAGLAIVILFGSAIPSSAQANPVSESMPVKFWYNGQAWDTYRYFPNSAYYVDNSGWCIEDHRVDGEKYDHGHTSHGFNFFEVNLQITVTQAMADAGYDYSYAVGILNWLRISNATMTHNCHGYSMGQTTPLIISSQKGSVRYRDESGYTLLHPPVSGGIYFDVLHSGKHPQIFHDGFFYRIGEQAEKRDASGVYFRDLSSAFVTIGQNWQN